ncbi:hypothetical protein TNCT_623901 [Trichonephila clavata]|uniref:Secreted protein n=1 Tax=Trichonephila clavata TaxID=2740835 RepID=A0A8X6KKN3_TRICU|nr:hypothetical protein TNCT_623901 [Trichonephila clavata]
MLFSALLMSIQVNSACAPFSHFQSRNNQSNGILRNVPFWDKFLVFGRLRKLMSNILLFAAEALNHTGSTSSPFLRRWFAEWLDQRHTGQ